MRRGTLRTPSWSLAAFGLAVALAGCGSSEDPNSIGTPGASTPSSTDPNATATSQTPAEQVQQILDARKTDYNEALRTASLKLTDALPTLDLINAIAAAPDLPSQKTIYEKDVDDMIASPAFAAMMVKYWKDTFKTGDTGTVKAGMASHDTAANFAAEVTVNGRPYSDIFTASSNTCPTFDPTANTFTDAACLVGTGAMAPATAGVLTDPGLLAAYYSNMAFRRNRFVQETFVCQKYPAEYSATPTPMGNGSYTNPEPFNNVTGLKNTAKPLIDFQDTSAVICANCHATKNGIAQLWMNFDANGFLQATSQVQVPVPGTPFAKPTDYQPTTNLNWRVGVPISDLPSLGKAIAADPDVAKCAVNRIWNYAMSRGDIVNDLATVPDVVTAQFVTDFTTGGMQLKETMRSVFKSDDFTKF